MKICNTIIHKQIYFKNAFSIHKAIKKDIFLQEKEKINFQQQNLINLIIIVINLLRNTE